jgi:hypothetical protein
MNWRMIKELALGRPLCTLNVRASPVRPATFTFFLCGRPPTAYRKPTAGIERLHHSGRRGGFLSQTQTLPDKKKIEMRQ